MIEPTKQESCCPALGEIETRTELSERLFREYYLKRGIPVLVKNFSKNFEGIDKWDFDYLKGKLSAIDLPLKEFNKDGSVELQTAPASSYIDKVLKYEDAMTVGCNNTPRPAYCHDIPIFTMAQNLVDDVRSIPSGLFPKWYRKEWWRYAQFFMSSSESCTPLHYDTLLTHNLFFQVKGRKQFILLPFTESKYCYRRDWRWYEVDPVNVDLEKHPHYKNASATKVVVDEGDLLFMPSGTLHHVVTEKASISFNVDFHTPASVAKSFLLVFKGMPLKNIYYNLLVMSGLWFRVPSKMVLKFYKSYLNYVS